MHNLTPKNLHINGLFFAKLKKSYFWVFLGIIPKMNFFFQKSGCVSFLRLKQPNFMRSFREILWAVLEKTRLPTDILIYWQWWNHRTPFLLKAGVQKIIMFTIAMRWLNTLQRERMMRNDCAIRWKTSTQREEYLTDKFTAL